MSRHPHVAAMVAALFVLSQGATSLASDYDFEISARTEGYGYQLRRYENDGIAFLNRRRLTQYLGLRIFNLLNDGTRLFAPNSQRPPALVTVQALMRFNADVGDYLSPYYSLPELENNEFDLMLATIEGRNLLGHLDFTLGRQFDTALLDFFTYDGLRVRVNGPARTFIESHVGVQVARARPFAAAVFERDGTGGDDPSAKAWSPTFGVAAGVEGSERFGLRAAYRGTASKVAPSLPAAADGKDDAVWGVDEEVVFFEASYRLPMLKTFSSFGARYNLLVGQVDDLQAMLVQPFTERHELTLEYLRSRPHFDGDSIFNIFSTEPYDELGGRYAVRPRAELELTARLGYRWFWSDSSSVEEVSTQPEALSAGLGGLWRSGRLRAGLDLYYLGGVERRGTFGGDLEGSWQLLRRMDLEGRFSLVSLRDVSRDSEELLTMGFQTGARFRFVRGVQLHLLLEDNISRLYKSALRLLGVLEMEVAP